MQLHEARRIAHSLIDELVLSLNKEDQTNRHQYKDKNSNVLFKMFGDMLSEYNINGERTIHDRYYLDTINSNTRYTKRITKNTSLRSKCFAIIDKDRSDSRRQDWYMKAKQEQSQGAK